MTKLCPTCGAIKPIAEFNKNARSRDGLQACCRVCANIRNAAHYTTNRVKIATNGAARYAANPAKKLAGCAAYRAANREKINSINDAYRAKNSDKEKERHAVYRAANKEKMNAYQAAYYVENRENIGIRHASYTVANPEANRIRRHNRRARERENSGKLSKGLAERLFKLQHGKCPCCKQPLGNNYHLDHIVPIALGGTNTDDNIQLLRATCNLQKHAKHPIEFMQSRGFLL